MVELIQANWPLFLVALLIGIAVAWFIFNAKRRTKVQTDSSDVLDEGASPAARNQALIDAPPVSAAPVVPPATPMGLAGAGAAVSAAAAEATQEAASPPPPPAKAATEGDDLSRIKGVGPKLRTMLGDMGIATFAEIAAWTEADIDRIDPQLGRFSGRIRRDDWVRQAKLLSAGDMPAYEAAFGKV